MTFGRILCEGYDDRAFWAGLCERHGWKSNSKEGERLGITGKGQFYFSKDEAGLVLQPVTGDKNLRGSLHALVNGRATKPYPWIILNCDSDAQEGKADIIVESVAKSSNLSDEERSQLAPFAWTTPRIEGAPNDDLERLIRHAVSRAHAARDAKVHEWLSGDGVEVEPRLASKAHVYALVAGWAANRGCQNFYRAVWEDPAVARELDELLALAPGWDRVKACLRSVR